MSYKFKVGDKGKTRRGSRYRVVADDRLHGRFPVVALVEWRIGAEVVGEALEGFTSTGDEQSAHENDGDLLPPTVTNVTKYLNAWYNTTTSYCGARLHPSAQAAKDAAAASADRTYVQVAVPVEVPES